jgi:tRNA(Phe) wybutosine-synthesizing methylase Tyw3
LESRFPQSCGLVSVMECGGEISAAWAKINSRWLFVFHGQKIVER